MKYNSIVLLKNNEPVKLFDNWFNAGKWTDENIKSEHTLYSFKKLNYFKSLLYKLEIWL